VQKYGMPHVEINLQYLQVCKSCKLQIQVIEFEGDTMDAGGLKWDQDRDLPPRTPGGGGDTNFPRLI